MFYTIASNHLQRLLFLLQFQIHFQLFLIFPFVTSSNTVPSNASTGSGVSIKQIGFILGIVKAYTTRVGSGPFPSELKCNIGKKLGTIGNEFGTVTGRERRCGWFDAIIVKHSIEVSGMDGIALTKLDVLDNFEEIKICIGYKLDGKKKLTISHIQSQNKKI